MITLIGVALFLFLVIGRIVRYEKIVRDKMIAVIIFAFFTVLFFIPFEQAATSMVIFARDYTDRVLTGNAALIFNIVNTLLTVIPLMIITWVLYLLNKKTFGKIPGSNVVLAVCFALVWGIVVWMLAQDFSTKAYEVEYQAVKIEQVVDGETSVVYEPITEARPLKAGETTETQVLTISSNNELKAGQAVGAHLELGKYRYLDDEKREKLVSDYAEAGLKSQLIMGEVVRAKENQVEITVSWFSILNSSLLLLLLRFSPNGGKVNTILQPL